MSEPQTFERERRSRDTVMLERFGYRQELWRRMNGFSNFAISFSIICTLAGGITSFHLGFGAAGVSIQPAAHPPAPREDTGPISRERRTGGAYGTALRPRLLSPGHRVEKTNTLQSAAWLLHLATSTVAAIAATSHSYRRQSPKRWTRPGRNDFRGSAFPASWSSNNTVFSNTSAIQVKLI